MKKTFLLGLGLICAVLLSVWLLTSADDLETESRDSEKKIELADTTARGYKDGRLLWSLQSKYIWSALNIDHAVVENIYNGKLYDGDKIVLDNLSARKVQANAPQERLFADKGFRALLYRGNHEPVDIWGEQLTYSAANKKSLLNKKVQVSDRNTNISAEHAEIDHQTNHISFGRDALLSRPDTVLTAESLLVDINNDTFWARHNVQLIRQGEISENKFRKQRTIITAAELTADTSGEQAQMTLSGKVLIKQADQQAAGDTAEYTEKDNRIYLRGNASIRQNDGSWLRAAQVIVDIAAEKFTATHAESTIYLDRPR
ncbi:hypothetical protein NO2_0734 [Candidatus Termititenax persephonae]|uniref:Organic solvent tolerance-like N-terminal domain-containing protein n=1 Tax=Candidatus Termititenax persephonae TaxID=2218525 RepID=A0A388TGC4_9BACT|nr:hypothetical protein NO2_0734 [Candidatus Termititenax persephonae]